MSVACYKSLGTSMQPFLLDGDELIVNTAPAILYAVGDIVLYRSPLFTQPVAHRVVGRGDVPNMLVVRADADPMMTETVPRESIIGRVDYLRRSDAVIRVGGTSAITMFNLGIARYYPAVLSAKETVAGMLLPGVACVQRLTLYRAFASRFVIPDIRVDRLGGTDTARVIATIRGRYAGSVDVEPRDVHGTRIGWVSSLYVRVRYRGAGIEARLIEVVEDHAAQAGMRELWIEIETGNRAAEGLYRKLDFHCVAPGSGESRNGHLLRRVIIGRGSPVGETTTCEQGR
jgi:GNAT superfamily N-acetyltransferase